MTYANERTAKTGDLVVAEDVGGNLVTGVVLNCSPGGLTMRLSGVPLAVAVDEALVVEDAYKLAMAVPVLQAEVRKLAEQNVFLHREASMNTAQTEASKPAPALHVEQEPANAVGQGGQGDPAPQTTGGESPPPANAS